jgi:hypothetical protein
MHFLQVFAGRFLDVFLLHPIGYSLAFLASLFFIPQAFTEGVMSMTIIGMAVALIAVLCWLMKNDESEEAPQDFLVCLFLLIAAAGLFFYVVMSALTAVVYALMVVAMMALKDFSVRLSASLWSDESVELGDYGPAALAFYFLGMVAMVITDVLCFDSSGIDSIAAIEPTFRMEDYMVPPEELMSFAEGNLDLMLRSISSMASSFIPFGLLLIALWSGAVVVVRRVTEVR